ncbi:MAG: hypothetical protein PWP23_1864 [Candidatus Sumerlaeota bacterium]|nr:hypothetical protein [Candidatus Sumerlaeota bacterium]
MSDDAQATNDKLAKKAIRAEINRILVRWDPLHLKGLRGADRAYEEFVAPLFVLAIKREDYMVIARHLDELMTTTWRMPRDKEACVANARKIYNTAAIFRGEEPLT